MKKLVTLIMCTLGLLSAHSIIGEKLSNEVVSPRMKIIIDNDFGGDPDGLFQLVHHLLSPSIEIKGVIPSHHYKNGFCGKPGSSDFAYSETQALLKVMKIDNISVYKGAEKSLKNLQNAQPSDGAKAIIQEAMQANKKRPLYVLCGAGLTNIASAYLIEPRIAERIRLIWIGGPEYPDLTNQAAGQKNPEYNLGIDILAAQVIFNHSNIDLWQIPRDAYRQTLFSYAELLYKVRKNGETGQYLTTKLEELMKRSKGSLGESYPLGDSPLVLLSALQSSWESDPSSSKYAIKNAPIITDKGKYIENPSGRKIRVYTLLDNRLMFEDLIAKLALQTLENNEDKKKINN